MASAPDVLQLLRPHHWVKNILLFAPLVFAEKFLDRGVLLQTVLGFVAFCLVASTVYILNDLADLVSDRLHPKKRARPIASGVVTPSQAVWLALLLASAGLVLGWWLSDVFVGVLLLYLLANVLYSRWLKHEPVLDLVVVSSFYLLRIFAGGVLAQVPISELLILTTFFLALFAVTIKRRQEFLQSKSSRRVLSAYTREFLDILSVVTAVSAITFYALYVTTKPTPFVWTTFFVVYALLRYVYLVFVHGRGEEPERLIVRDPGIVIAGLGWVACNMYLLYTL